jgi:hypothetical protein
MRCLRVLCFFILSVLLIEPGVVFGAPRKKGGGGEPPIAGMRGEESTRLHARAPSVVYVSKRGQTQIEHINVEVTNVGTTAAVGVEVAAEWNGGIAYLLRGARRLGPRQRALYTLGTRRLLVSTGAPRIVARCANCKR